MKNLLIPFLFAVIGCTATEEVTTEKQAIDALLAKADVPGTDSVSQYRALLKIMRASLAEPVKLLLNGKEPVYVKAIEDRINDNPTRFVSVLRIDSKEVKDDKTYVAAYVRVNLEKLRSEIEMLLRSMRVDRMPRVLIKVAGGNSGEMSDASLVTDTIQASLLKKDYKVDKLADNQAADIITANGVGAEYIFDASIAMTGAIHLVLTDATTGEVILKKSATIVLKDNTESLIAAANELANATALLIGKIWKAGQARDVKIIVRGISFLEQVRIKKEIDITRGILKTHAGSFKENTATITALCSEDLQILADSLTRLTSVGLKIKKLGLNTIELVKY